MTQYELILLWLRENGSITPMEAFNHLGITKLATRIGEMIRNGVKIIKTREEGLNRYGVKTHWVKYTLKQA